MRSPETATLRRMGLLAVVALAAACSGESAGDPSVDENRSEPLFLTDQYPLKTWRRVIPVCFSSATAARPELPFIKMMIRNSLARSWIQATGLRFTGVSTYDFQQCPFDGFPATINVGVNNFDGNGAQTCSNDTHKNGCPNRVDINFANMTAVDEVHIMHEFGHALGFEHERRRPDFHDDPACSESNVKGDTLHTVPDPDSIMDATYCHVTPELSSWDITGVQNKWGRPVWFADVTGDGLADAIIVNPAGVDVRPNDGNGTFPISGQTNWTGGFTAGVRGTHFADVTGPDGDGQRRADLILVGDSKIQVRRSNGGAFQPATSWTSGKFYGDRGTYFADVNGDGRDDAIAVNRSQGVLVSLSDGTRFAAAENWWPHDLTTLNTYESRNYFADVTGPDPDGLRRADLIAINSDGIYVCPALMNNTFSDSCVNQATFGFSRGNVGNFFADVDGDGYDDFVLIDSLTVSDLGLTATLKVRHNLGALLPFLPPNFPMFPSEFVMTSGFVSERGIALARVTGAPGADLVFVKESGVFVQQLSDGTTPYNATGGPYYGLR